METLKVAGWYATSQQFNQYYGWLTVMHYLHSDRSKRPEGAWWHEEGQEVNAIVQY